jgi:hypothetical protein
MSVDLGQILLIALPSCLATGVLVGIMWKVYERRLAQLKPATVKIQRDS